MRDFFSFMKVVILFPLERDVHRLWWLQQNRISRVWNKNNKKLRLSFFIKILIRIEEGPEARLN